MNTKWKYRLFACGGAGMALIIAEVADEFGINMIPSDVSLAKLVRGAYGSAGAILSVVFLAIIRKRKKSTKAQYNQ